MERNQLTTKTARRCPWRGSCFTFVEVLIACLILTMAVAMTLGIVGAARARILRAEKRWGRDHLLGQAAEFYLLAGKDAAMPNGVLPDNFHARCEVQPAADLPENASESVTGWPDWQLAVYRITVFDPSGESIGERVVEKILHEDDLY